MICKRYSKEVPLETQVDLQYDPAIPHLGINLEDSEHEAEILAHLHLVLHCSQQPSCGTSLDAHQHTQ